MPLTKGAFVVFGAAAPVPTGIIWFQFNSDTLRRSIAPPTAEQRRPEADPGTTPAHTPGPPTETFQLIIELDAADALADGDPIAGTLGLHPALAQLELLMYPSSAITLLNRVLQAAGAAMVTPAETPAVLFAWGAARVLPVRVTSLSITEENFDNDLNPISAKVEVQLTVMGDEELATLGEPFSTLATVMHVAKEAFAATAQVQQLAAVRLPF